MKIKLDNVEFVNVQDITAYLIGKPQGDVFIVSQNVFRQMMDYEYPKVYRMDGIGCARKNDYGQVCIADIWGYCVADDMVGHIGSHDDFEKLIDDNEEDDEEDDYNFDGVKIEDYM